jgi:hypothetical protein
MEYGLPTSFLSLALTSMSSHLYYLLRSKLDGSYLIARPHQESNHKKSNDTIEPGKSGYVLLFREHYDALSYINAHGADVAHRFTVESIFDSQIGTLLERWGWLGVGIVQDPLIPRVEFLSH